MKRLLQFSLGIAAVLSVPGITGVADGTMLHVDGTVGAVPNRLTEAARPPPLIIEAAIDPSLAGVEPVRSAHRQTRMSTGA